MKVVVIGNGMVGQKFCEKILAKNIKGLELIVFGEEILPAYDRVHLSEYFTGKQISDLCLQPVKWYKENGISLYLGDPIKHVDRENKIVVSQENVTLSYDFLVFATGSSSFVPNIPGIDKAGVFVYRTIQDLNLIWRHAPTCKNAVVMGGGLLGLEAAKAMLDLGIHDTHVIEFAPRLMPRQIDDGASDILKQKLKELGIISHTGKITAAVLGNESITGLMFSDGSILNADILVISAGIRPRDELAKSCGLEIGERGGIVVDDNMVTSDSSIFAIGECALHNSMIYGLVAPGYEMADVAVNQIWGERKSFNGFDMSSKLKLMGVDVASFGEPFIQGDEVRTIVFQDQHKGVYKRINFSKNGKQLLGGILVGDATDYNMLLQICKNKILLPESPMDVIIKANTTNSSTSLVGVDALPDEALICSCESITKAQIVDAVINKGCNSLEGIKKCTKATSGCGGCTPMVKDIMNQVLAAEGHELKNNICEHFDYSRQELFDLIKVKELRSFDQVIDVLGHGDGCEVCRPVVSSVLASLWNELIVKEENATSQDTNDRFLANIQKGGSYSVVPRIPGGEITPDKLLVIATVAKKYGLYTKITGGQRIDMFGAHVNDLPLIWEELIEAGFESGHAYGKALRTVKSCVGSTWCRYGLHDSVSFAIQIENRYKGLRSPHKIKSAVSGCIRECAEAQSKDFGIIATEKGWNLFVCGNGGSKPQHAQLLASDIDSDTCIKYIDRFLMFYIKTAEPLTRTATWLNKMEGGINYLRQVVIKDSLGIASSLENDMRLLLENYKCEWKAVIESPELSKRFSHFINEPTQKDPSIEFVEMRGQKKTPTW